MTRTVSIVVGMNDLNVLTIVTIKIVSRPVSIVVDMNGLNVLTIVARVKIMSRSVSVVVDMNVLNAATIRVVTIKIVTCVLIHRALSTRV
jgi:hypothetical protein